MSVELDQMVKQALIGSLEDLRKGIRTAVEPLSEAAFWQRPLEPGNSVGHLIQHLAGNLSFFVGTHLGKTGYVREREKEFTEQKAASKDQALRQLDEAVALFADVVGKLTPEQLAAPHPEARFGPVLAALVHLVSHFALHRGQISYLVRLVKPT